MSRVFFVKKFAWEDAFSNWQPVMDNRSHWSLSGAHETWRRKNYFLLYFFVCFPARCQRGRGEGWCFLKWLNEGDTFFALHQLIRCLTSGDFLLGLLYWCWSSFLVSLPLSVLFQLPFFLSPSLYTICAFLVVVGIFGLELRVYSRYLNSFGGNQ